MNTETKNRLVKILDKIKSMERDRRTCVSIPNRIGKYNALQLKARTLMMEWVESEADERKATK